MSPVIFRIESKNVDYLMSQLRDFVCRKSNKAVEVSFWFDSNFVTPGCMKYMFNFADCFMLYSDSLIFTCFVIDNQSYDRVARLTPNQNLKRNTQYEKIKDTTIPRKKYNKQLF